MQHCMQVSHHVHCNDEALDEDVFSAFPLLRFDARLPRKAWHPYQHIYMWATFPLLQLGFQFTDIASLLDNRTPGATIYGATDTEKRSVVLGKLAHYSLLWFVPAALHGWGSVWPAALAYIFVQGLVLATTFAVSHNIPETKGSFEGAEAVSQPVRFVLKPSL
jgi:acyl-lipid (7-3)-desaturase (Delta-4 desaturase)